MNWMSCSSSFTKLMAPPTIDAWSPCFLKEREMLTISIKFKGGSMKFTLVIFYDDVYIFKLLYRLEHFTVGNDLAHKKKINFIITLQIRSTCIDL